MNKKSRIGLPIMNLWGRALIYTLIIYFVSLFFGGISLVKILGIYLGVVLALYILGYRNSP